MRNSVLISCLLGISLLAGCSTMPVSSRLPSGVTVLPLTSLTADSPFAPSPDGAVIAFFDNGLQLLHTPTGEKHRIGESRPEAVTWSPTGFYLAALHRRDNGSSIAIYDQIGSKVTEQQFDDTITDIGWLSDDEIIAGGLRTKVYKFGTTYQSIMLRWKPGQSLPVFTDLKSATLRPSTYTQWRSYLARGPQLTVCPTSGIVAYLHPADPPMFNTYYKLIIRDVASGLELGIADVALNAGKAAISPDGEKLLFSDGSGNLSLYNPWSAEMAQIVATSGNHIALSPDGLSWFSDGKLSSGGATDAVSAPEGVGIFSADGRSLFLKVGTELYRLSGIKPAGDSHFIPEVAKKIDTLRSMRLKGLISAGEYKSSLERITKQ